MVLVVPLVWIVFSQAPPIPLSGSVVSPDGKPVAGAEILLAGLPDHDPPRAARTRSDADGRFNLQYPAGAIAEGGSLTPILWAVKPHFRLGVMQLPGEMPSPGEAVCVTLRPAGKAELRIEGPLGEPLAGARIRLEWFGRDGTRVPEAVGDLVEATTDRDGRAVLDAATNEEVAYVDVHAKGFGIQGRPFFPATKNPKHIRLRTVASLEGRLQADDPAMVRGWRVLAYTRSGDPSSLDPPTTGFSQGTTDAEGRFSFLAIAPGGLQLELKPPGDLPVVADVPTSLAVIEGQRNTVVVPLRKTSVVTGVVRERGSGQPVAVVELYFYRFPGGRTVIGKTDAQGQFRFSTLPGKVGITVFRTPPTHVMTPGHRWDDFEVSEGSGGIELEPREASPSAPPLRFVVRDEAGRPVPHAVISGQSSSRWMPQHSDENGTFAIPGLAPGDDVAIEAQYEGRMTDGPVRARAGTTDIVPIPIVPGLSVMLAGRVVGPAETPIADAVVHAQYREMQTQGGGFRFPQTPAFGAGRDIRTGIDGKFHTPKDIYRKDREFRVDAAAPGFFGGKTDWIGAERGDLITIPDLVLRPRPSQRLVSGRVIDRQGKGIPAVLVFQPGVSPLRISSTTDGEGRFRLDGVPSTSALVFTQKAGYRFGGAIVGPSDAQVEIRMARHEEPPRSIPRLLPVPLSRAQERAISRELLAPLVEPSRSGALGNTGGGVLPALARVDPDRVLGMLEDRAIREPSGVIQKVALAQFEDEPDAAIATLGADGDPTARAEGFLRLADTLPVAGRARRLELIDRALAEAGRVEDKESRLRILGHIADRWLELGLLDRAISVIRQGRSIIATLPKDQYSFAIEEFAEVLVVIDVRTARSIFERKGRTNTAPADPGTLHRHLGEAAVRLALVDPAEAERLVAEVEPNYWDDARARDIFRVCQRMAQVDLPRTRRILETIDKPAESDPRRSLVPEGLGLMADALADSDPTGARRLLDEAFDRLWSLASEGNPYQNPSAANVMATLLPVVERVDPDRLEERIWLTAACRTPLPEQAFPDAAMSPVVLAALVARYDRAMAEVLIAPVLPRLAELLVDSFGINPNQAGMVKALATLDPRAVTALLRELPDSARRVPVPHADWNAASLDAHVRLAAAEALGLPVDERYREILGGYLGWPSIRQRR